MGADKNVLKRRMDFAIVVHLQQSMEEGKDQESKQSTTIRELGHHMGK